MSSSEISGEDLFLGGKGGTSIVSGLLFREPPLLCFLTLGDELKLGQDTYMYNTPLHRVRSSYKYYSYREQYVHVIVWIFKFLKRSLLLHACAQQNIHVRLYSAPTLFSSAWLAELQSPS